MKNSTAYYDEEQELFEEEQERRDKKARRKKVQRVIDRIFGFILATGILFGVAGLAVEYVLVKGPSPALRNMFVNTMLETRRFGFIASRLTATRKITVRDALWKISVCVGKVCSLRLALLTKRARGASLTNTHTRFCGASG